jgi:phosphoribosylanthranilate isomerase
LGQVPGVYVKICGLTSPEQADAVAALGPDAIGLNLIPSSKRFVAPDAALRIAEAVRGRVEIVGVVADVPPDRLRELRERTGCDVFQLHGAETPEQVAALGALAFKALRIAGAADVAQARAFPGDRLLVDAWVPGALGGTGESFDWELLGDLPVQRRLVLAGGLRPDNVAAAVRRVRPYGVDIASGVERGSPRLKDLELVSAFIRAARAAASGAR